MREILWLWYIKSYSNGNEVKKLEHDYSIAGWALRVMPAVRGNVVEHMTGVHCDAIERVVTKMHEPPCTIKSKEIEGKTISDILEIFWL